MAKGNTSAFDLVIIGGGPAGYVGAIRATQLGLSVACIERDKLGGVCLNWGCIPTKALLAQAEFYYRLTREAEEWGVEADNVRHHWEKVIGRSRTVAGNLNKGIHGLFKKNKITHIEGHAKITKAGPPATIEIHDKPDHVAQTVTARHVMIATGAAPRELPFAPFDGKDIIASKEAMTLTEQPKRLVVIGAGAIGMEFAYFYNAFGTEVTVIEMLDRVVPNEDSDVSKAVAKAFKRQGIDCRTGLKTTAIEKTDEGMKVTVASVNDEKKTESLVGDKVLVAIGVRGRFDGLFGEGVEVEQYKDHIKVDRETYATSVKGLYAVGDVIGPPWLAHVASEEAIVCVERIAGHEVTPVDYRGVPACTYCQPQIASVGRTEDALKAEGKKQGDDYLVGQFPFQASGKAQAIGNTAGFVKLITDAKYGEILGAHMVGENVTEMIAEIGLAMRLEATAEEVIATMHAHPTLSEAVHEAALGSDGRMIHF